MKLAPGIDLVGGAEFDSNMYVIDGEVLVDCGSGVFFEQTLEQMKRYGIKISGIKMIILTHGHIDHIGAAKQFKQKTKAPVAIHGDDAICLEKGEGTFAEEFDIDFKGFSPDIVMKDGGTVKTPNHTFKVMHTPGHTPGSICLWDEEKGILISGDVMFSDAIGRTDFPRSDPKEMKKSLEKIRSLNVRTLLPGHGTPIVESNPYDKGKMEKAMGISQEIEDYL